MGGSLARGEFGAFRKVKGHSRGLLTLLKVKWILSRRITFQCKKCTVYVQLC